VQVDAGSQDRSRSFQRASSTERGEGRSRSSGSSDGRGTRQPSTTARASEVQPRTRERKDISMWGRKGTFPVPPPERPAHETINVDV